MSKLLYPKTTYKKKRKHYPESILHDKTSRTCYLCEHHGDYSLKPVLHEHHIFPGSANRSLSEKYGLKVYLCPDCHQNAPDSVHKSPQGENNRFLQEEGRKAFERVYPNEDFRKIFGKNYL